MKWEFKENHTFGKDYEEKFVSVCVSMKGVVALADIYSELVLLAQTWPLFNGVWRCRWRFVPV